MEMGKNAEKQEKMQKMKMEKNAKMCKSINNKIRKNAEINIDRNKIIENGEKEIEKKTPKYRNKNV